MKTTISIEVSVSLERTCCKITNYISAEHGDCSIFYRTDVKSFAISFVRFEGCWKLYLTSKDFVNCTKFYFITINERRWCSLIVSVLCTCWSELSVRCCLLLHNRTFKIQLYNLLFSRKAICLWSERAVDFVYLHTWWKFVTNSALTTGGCEMCDHFTADVFIRFNFSHRHLSTQWAFERNKRKKHQMDVRDEARRKRKTLIVHCSCGC